VPPKVAVPPTVTRSRTPLPRSSLRVPDGVLVKLPVTASVPITPLPPGATVVVFGRFPCQVPAPPPEVVRRL